jgi:hypothetical protein
MVVGRSCIPAEYYARAAPPGTIDSVIEVLRSISQRPHWRLASLVAAMALL